MDINILDNPMPPTIPTLEQELRKAFPQYKISKPLLNPNMLLVQNGMVLAAVRFRGQTLRVKGGLNTQNIAVVLPIALGVLFGFIGALVVALLLYFSFSNQSKAHEKEISDFLTDYLNENQEISGLV